MFYPTITYELYTDNGSIIHAISSLIFIKGVRDTMVGDTKESGFGSGKKKKRGTLLHLIVFWEATTFVHTYV